MSTAAGQQTTWLTQEAYDRLSAELEEAKGPRRADIVAKIEAARDEGDLKENGGYHAAREEQGQMEARIRQLTDMLRRAEVGDAPDDPDEVAAGTRITIAFDGDTSDTDTFLLGSREVLGLDEAADDINVYSPQSPLGSAILGRRRGDQVTYTAPNGKPISVTVLEVEPFRS